LSQFRTSFDQSKQGTLGNNLKEARKEI
jgi:hypothetical protein